MNKGITTLATDVDLSKLLSVLPSIDSDIWNEWTKRQDKFGVHKYTKTIPIKWLEKCVCKHSEITLAVEPYINKVENIFNSKCVNALLIYLPAGASIAPHVDSGSILNKVYRCHYPILSNPEVEFVSKGVSYYMEPGNLYRLQNTAMHAVYNNSNKPRIHLLVDVYK